MSPFPTLYTSAATAATLSQVGVVGTRQDLEAVRQPENARPPAVLIPECFLRLRGHLCQDILNAHR